MLSYGFRNPGYPEVDVALRWVTNIELPDERPVCLDLDDVGPDQIRFGGDNVAALDNFQFAQIGDPLHEIYGGNLLYHIERMPEHLRYYGTCYERLTGVLLSLASHKYWPVAGTVLRQVPTISGTQLPRATSVDTAFMFLYEVIMKRRVTEGLAEQFDLELGRPNVTGTTLGRLHDVMVRQLEDYYPARMVQHEKPIFVKYSAVIAERLHRGEACHLYFECDNLEELGELLGCKPNYIEDGLFKWETRIASDRQGAFERRPRFSYRYECRRKAPYEPMQRATGVFHAVPLEPIN